MRQAVILAGGQATRMRPYTDDRPKAMVEVAGRPILEHQLRWLASGDVHDVVLSVGYKSEVIRDHIGDGSALGMRVDYAVEDEPLGRGGGLRFAALRLPHPDEGWYGMNGDVLSRFDIGELAAQHERLEATATIALAPYRTTWGIADLDGDLVRGFVQSPRLPYWINAGIYCMGPDMVGLLPEKGDHEDSTFPSLALAGKLGAYRIEGYWRGIDTVKDVKEASADLLSGSV